MNIPFDKFCGFKIYEKDNLIRHFKPCINENGIIGVYDFVSNKFFKLDGVENYKVKEVKETKMDCNCWRCVAERLFNARRVSKMKIGKVYLHQMYSESFEEFDTVEQTEQFREHANENIPYWNYDPVSLIDLNDYEQVIICRHRGWVNDDND